MESRWTGGKHWKATGGPKNFDAENRYLWFSGAENLPTFNQSIDDIEPQFYLILAYPNILPVNPHKNSVLNQIYQLYKSSLLLKLYFYIL